MIYNIPDSLGIQQLLTVLNITIFIIYYIRIHIITIFYQVAKFGLLVVKESSKPQIQNLISGPAT